MQCMIGNRKLYMEIKEESGLRFGFPKENTVVKFDDTAFYRDYFNKLPEAKGVDFISLEKDAISMIEVKNCMGHEGENRWRIEPNNHKKETSHTTVGLDGRDSLDIEVAQKTAMTLSGLIGAKTYENSKECVKEVEEIIHFLCSESFSDVAKQKYIILFLEGNFECHSRSKKMIMRSLQDSLKRKLSWLNCKVSVVDSDTYDRRRFEIVN